MGDLDDEVAEQRVAGEVAAQDHIEADAVAGCLASLGEERGRDRDRTGLPSLDAAEPVANRGANGGAQSLDVGRISCLGCVVERTDASSDRLLDLGAAHLQV
jgi:hypothetical protein